MRVLSLSRFFSGVTLCIGTKACKVGLVHRQGILWVPAMYKLDFFAILYTSSNFENQKWPCEHRLTWGWFAHVRDFLSKIETVHLFQNIEITQSSSKSKKYINICTEIKNNNNVSVQALDSVCASDFFQATVTWDHKGLPCGSSFRKEGKKSMGTGVLSPDKEWTPCHRGVLLAFSHPFPLQQTRSSTTNCYWTNVDSVLGQAPPCMSDTCSKHSTIQAQI